jgi:hypothetical protein
MGQPHAQTGHEDDDLRGTFMFVLLVAAIIVIIWVTVFLLFLSRY